MDVDFPYHDYDIPIIYANIYGSAVILPPLLMGHHIEVERSDRLEWKGHDVAAGEADL